MGYSGVGKLPLRKSLGDSPLRRLKKREKRKGSSKPRESASSETVRLVSRRRRRAVSKRCWSISILAGMPRWVRKTRLR